MLASVHMILAVLVQNALHLWSKVFIVYLFDNKNVDVVIPLHVAKLFM